MGVNGRHLQNVRIGELYMGLADIAGGRGDVAQTPSKDQRYSQDRRV